MFQALSHWTVFKDLLEFNGEQLRLLGISYKLLHVQRTIDRRSCQLSEKIVLCFRTTDPAVLKGFEMLNSIFSHFL